MPEFLFKSLNYCFRWNCHSTTHRGSSLRHLVTHLDLSIHALNTPTHLGYGKSHPSIIDFAIFKKYFLPYYNYCYKLPHFRSFSCWHHNWPGRFFFSPPTVAVDWSKYKNIHLTSDLTFPNISNSDDTGTAVNHFQNLIINVKTWQLLLCET